MTVNGISLLPPARPSRPATCRATSASAISRRGNLDLVIANHQTAYVTLLLGDGEGGFRPAPHSPFATTAKPHPHGVAVGRFCGPGRPLDVVIDSWGSEQIELLEGDGHGELTNGPMFPAGPGSDSPLGSADFDGDGMPDVVVTCSQRDSVLVFHSVNAGGFDGSAVRIPTGGANDAVAERGVLIAPVVANRPPDIVATNGSAGTISPGGAPDNPAPVMALQFVAACPRRSLPPQAPIGEEVKKGEQMKIKTATLLAVALVLTFTPFARAQGTGVEVGTSLVSLIFDTDNPRTTVFGVPSGGFGLINPGLYASFFATPHLAVEPQVGLLVVSGNGHTESVVNFAGQVDYFVRDARVSSPYVFGGVGMLHASGASQTPTSLSAGAGYRVRAAGRVTFRIDGRFTYYTKGIGNQVAFTLSLGGVFGGR